MKKRTMYLIVCFFVMVHILIMLIWLIKGSVNSTLAYTKGLLEYSKCYYPVSKNIR